MEATVTNNYVSEHMVVLEQQREVVSEIEYVVDKLSKILYTLETTDELVDAMILKLEKINACLSEFHRLDSLIESVYQEEIQKMKRNFESHVGIVERDEGHNLHCGKCMIPYKYCQDMEGKKVRLSLITLNCRAGTRKDYPFFANHVEVIE